MYPFFYFVQAFYNDLPTYPVKHTAYDTYNYVKRFIDPDMSIHAAVTEVVAEALLSLADDPLLNIQVVNYADAMVEYYRDIRKINETNFGPKNSLGMYKYNFQTYSKVEHEMKYNATELLGIWSFSFLVYFNQCVKTFCYCVTVQNQMY